METTSAETSPYHSDASEYCGTFSESSIDLNSSVNWPIKPNAYTVSRLPGQAHRQQHCRQQSDGKPPSKRATKEEFSMTLSKHTMRLRTCRLVFATAGEPHDRKFHSVSPPQTTLGHNVHFKSRLRSASAPNPAFTASANRAPPKVGKARKCLPTRSATGDSDDLERWEWDDPVVRRLADAVFAIREERKLTRERLEAIDEKIETLKRHLVGRDAA